MTELKISNETYPPSMSVYKDGVFKGKYDIDSFEDKVDEIVSQLDCSMFEIIKLKRAMIKFEMKAVTFQEKDLDEK